MAINKFCPIHSYKLKDVDPINIRNEIAILKHIQKAARESLKVYSLKLEPPELTVGQTQRFPDPLALDHKLLKENKFMDMNHRNSIMMRSGEKEVCIFF